jgi:UDP-N-acetylmuramate--alanine ligase
LLALSPELSVLTNVELDHVRVYRSVQEVERVFSQFLRQSERAVIWNRAALLRLADRPAIPFDALDPTPTGVGQRFRWREFEVTLRVPGEHNARNAAAALEACAAVGADPRACVGALETFPGTRRRFEALGRTHVGAAVYDDYAHHPTAVRATLEAARTLEPDRLIAVLQPYSFARTRLMSHAFGDALSLADIAVVLDVVGGSGPEQPVSGLVVAAAAADAGRSVTVAWMPTVESAEWYLSSLLRDGDLCVVMGAGDMQRLAHRLAA